MGRIFLPIVALIFSAVARAAPSTTVTLSFDDGFADQFPVREMLTDAGFHATFFVNSGRIGSTTKYMTLDQIGLLAQDGNEIGGHTINHLHLPALAPDEAFRQICVDRAFLVDAGFVVTSFAYPFGDDWYGPDGGPDSGTDGLFDSGAIWSVVQSVGYNSARDIGGIVVPGGCNGCPYAQKLPIPNGPGHELDIFHTRTPGSIGVGVSLAQMEQFVTQAQDAGGGWVQIVMHHVCPQAPCDPSVEDSGVQADQLGQFLTWLSEEQDAGNVLVKTTDEVIGGAEAPLVPCPDLVDAGADAGLDGGGLQDAGPDAGADAGIDAGLDDGGTFDGGVTDASTDAGFYYPDTGPSLDAGPPDSGPPDEDGGLPSGVTVSGGCGCGSTGATGALWLALPLVLLRRRSGSVG